jgi:hypothetical protein
VVNALLLKPLPYPNPDRLAALWLRSPGLGIPQDWPSPGSLAAIIDQKTAQRFWPHGGAIGKHVWFDPKKPFTIVGVVGIVARSSGGPGSLAASMVREVHALDRDVPVYDVRTMDDRMYDSLARQRFAATMLGAFAVFALILAAIGVYGAISYLVTQGPGALTPNNKLAMTRVNAAAPSKPHTIPIPASSIPRLTTILRMLPRDAPSAKGYAGGSDGGSSGRVADSAPRQRGCMARLKRWRSSGVKSFQPRTKRALCILRPQPPNLPNSTRLSKRSPSACQKPIAGRPMMAGISAFHRPRVTSPINPAHTIPNRTKGAPTNLNLLIYFSFRNPIRHRYVEDGFADA